MGKKNFKILLKKVKIIALDSLCFIYYFEDAAPYASLLEDIFLGVKGKTLVSSTLTLSELLAKKEIVESESKMILLKTAFLTVPNLQIVPPSIEIAENAALLKIKYNLTLPDAIHLTTAISQKADIFITNDKKFKRVKEIKVVLLKEILYSPNQRGSIAGT